MADAEMENEYEGFEKRDVQKLLLKSFLVVVFCYTLFMTGMAIIGGLVFYEAFQAAANLEPDVFTRELNENSAELFKRNRFLPFVALASLFCAGLGWLIVKLAPFSQMVHGVILVLLVAATMFVFATGENTPAEIQTVCLIMVAAGAIALVIGAKMGSRSRTYEESTEH